MSAKITSIGFLGDGQKFKFVGLENYKDCSVVRWSESGTTIKGMHKSLIDDPWRPLNPGYVVSNESQVVAL